MMTFKPFGGSLLVGLGLLGATMAAQAQGARQLSLVNEIKAEFPSRQKAIADKCDGAVVAIDVDFASFGDNFDALLKVPQQGLKETQNGVTRFCTNSNRTAEHDAAKTGALKTKVKTILLRHVPKIEDKGIALQPGGTVVIAMSFDKLPGGLSFTEIAAKLGEIL